MPKGKNDNGTHRFPACPHSNLKQTPQSWQTVASVYHATDEIASAEAVRSGKLRYKGGETGPLSMFLCRLCHRDDGSVVNINNREGRPTISPYAEHQVVFPVTQVFREREDYLLPLRPYDIPPLHDPGEEFRSCGGKKHFEMVLIRHEDIRSTNFLTDPEWSDLQKWRLGHHPFVHLDGDGNLSYRVIKDLWWLILTPYHVPIPNDAHWEDTRFWGSPCKASDGMQPREVTNPLTKKLVENLPGLFA